MIKMCVLIMLFCISISFASCPFLYNVENCDSLNIEVCSDNCRLIIPAGCANYAGDTLTWTLEYCTIPTIDNLEIAYVGVTCDSTIYITTTNILDPEYTSCNAMLGILSKYNGQHIFQRFNGVFR
jgi:hypothetical protein